ncbi:Odorant receptor 9a [Pseudolycoriella hygida]|uniref:Odorant receptor n=1 Tax=Pseudolycoriella hygida TaxID=35572 RepID=A0A9Q0N5J9_9DIPT|nr:Odorant receptor 9a [Pseudolycoriella hygida]
MIVLKSLQKAMQVVGLLFPYSDGVLYRIYRWTSFFILASMLQPSCRYLYVYYQDLIKATEICVFAVAEAVMMAKVLFIIYNQKSVIRLLKELQEMADEKIKLNRTKILCKFNKEAEMISKAFIGMLGIASCIFVGGPALAIFYRKLQGTYVAHMYGHPYKGYFPYDFETTPGYEITYALNCVYNVYLATYFAACDLFFVNCGLHLISATLDLEDSFKEIDNVRKDELLKTECGRSVGACRSVVPMSDSLANQLNENIKTHYKIIELSDVLKSVVEGLIFSQFFGVIFSLSAIAFQVVSSEGEQRFFFTAPTIVILAQLFLYCFYGQRVTDQAVKFSESIYQLRWYNYPTKYQKHFQLIILRTQNSNYLTGLGFVKCSLESFTDVRFMKLEHFLHKTQSIGSSIQVVKFAGSVVALFRNLQK